MTVAVVVGLLAVAVALFAVARESRYRDLLRQAPDGLLLVDPESRRIVEGNTRFATLTGYSEKELVDLPLERVLDASVIGDLLAGAGTCHGDLVSRTIQSYSTRDGTQIVAEVNASRISTGSRDVILLALRNVSPATLRDGRVRRIADEVHDLIAEVDLDGVLRWASASHAIVTGHLPEELQGEDAIRFVHPEDYDALRKAVAPIVQADGPRTVEYRFRRRDGHFIWLESIFMTVPGRNGEPSGLVVTSRDVSERRRMEDVLSLLDETGRRTLAREPLDETLVYVCETLSRLLEAPLVWIGLKRADGTAEVRAAGGRALALLDSFELRWDEGLDSLPLPCRALAAGETQVAREPSEIPAPYRELSRISGIGAVAATPLVRQGETFGVLAVHAQRAETISGRSLPLLSRLGDIVALALVEAEQRDAMEVQAAALESTANTVVILGPDGRVQWANAAFEHLTGFSRFEVEGLPMSTFESDLHPPAFWESLHETLRLGSVWRGEVFSRRKDGTVFVEQQTITPVRRDDGTIRCFIAVHQDVTRERRTIDRLRRLVDCDSLTELPNRQRIETSLERLVTRAKRGKPSALLLVDLDNFKLVNDGSGHLVGDRVLVEVAQVLRAELRPGDELARLGGDEFVILLEETGLEAAKRAAERLRQRVEDNRFEIGGRAFELALSVGLAVVDGRLGPGEVLALADAAVHTAKERGRNRVVVGQPSLLGDSPLARASTCVTTVKRALRHGGLLLHLQPIVHLGSRRTVHHEVLLRMRDGAQGLVAPGEFLPASEQFGLMPQIDRWVLSNVLDLLEERPDLDVFMNLSGSSLAEGDLLDEMEEMVRARCLSPGRLSFEITETAAVGDVAAARQWLLRLKELGCRFALDDFGIGFSSFSYLQTLPVDYVKIDASFVRSLEKDRTNREIVTAVVAIAHSLGKETIAEGVEDLRALQTLRDLGVEYGQGWVLGMPVESSEVPYSLGSDSTAQEGIHSSWTAGAA